MDLNLTVLTDQVTARIFEGDSKGRRLGVICVTIKQDFVQPRLYDCLMVTQITLNTEPHGFDSCQGRSSSYEKFATNRGTFVVPGRSGVALVTLDETNGSPLSRVVAFAHGSVLSSVQRDCNRSRLR